LSTKTLKPVSNETIEEHDTEVQADISNFEMAILNVEDDTTQVEEFKLRNNYIKLKNKFKCQKQNTDKGYVK
jgi:hypothetical protein